MYMISIENTNRIDFFYRNFSYNIRRSLGYCTTFGGGGSYAFILVPILHTLMWVEFTEVQDVIAHR